MSNLGGYKTAVQVIKVLGGPKKALVIGLTTVGAAGYGVLRFGEASWKKGRGALKTVVAKRAGSDALTDAVFLVHTNGTDSRDLEFKAEDQYRVLEHDADAVLIELVGNDDNPHVVSGTYLASISDFPLGPTTESD